MPFGKRSTFSAIAEFLSVYVMTNAQAQHVVFFNMYLKKQKRHSTRHPRAYTCPLLRSTTPRSPCMQRSLIQLGIYRPIIRLSRGDDASKIIVTISRYVTPVPFIRSVISTAVSVHRRRPDDDDGSDLIQLFSLGVTAEALQATIGRKSNAVSLAQNFRQNVTSPANNFCTDSQANEYSTTPRRAFK